MPAPVLIYTKHGCPYCVKAKKLLNELGVRYDEVDVGADMKNRQLMMEQTRGAKTVPQIFVGNIYVGGSDNLEEWVNDGRFAEALSTGIGRARRNVRFSQRLEMGPSAAARTARGSRKRLRRRPSPPTSSVSESEGFSSTPSHASSQSASQTPSPSPLPTRRRAALTKAPARAPRTAATKEPAARPKKVGTKAASPSIRAGKAASPSVRAGKAASPSVRAGKAASPNINFRAVAVPKSPTVKPKNPPVRVKSPGTKAPSRAPVKRTRVPVTRGKSRPKSPSYSRAARPVLTSPARHERDEYSQEDYY